jgi:ethanolamine ammonia-lyase small subunit
VLVQQGRVAIADDIGERLGARMSLILIGERPGLSSPDSLGIYYTFQPKVGRNDAQRNCVSNIRLEGLSYDTAAHRLMGLMRASYARNLSGVLLKDEANDTDGSALTETPLFSLT